jgi:hypothetical protein
MHSYIPRGGVKTKGIATFARSGYVHSNSGFVVVSGCARIERRIFVNYRWGERSVVFLKYKAEKGIMEKIAVKKVILNFKLGSYTPVYMDTLNSLYNEEELINEEQAKTLVQLYIDRQKSAIAASIRQCGASTI